MAIRTVTYAAVHLHDHGVKAPSKRGRQARPSPYVKEEPGQNACLRELCSLMLEGSRVGEHPAPEASHIILEHRLLKCKLGTRAPSLRLPPSSYHDVYKPERKGERSVVHAARACKPEDISRSSQPSAWPRLRLCRATGKRPRSCYGPPYKGEPEAMKDVSGALSGNYDCVCQALGWRGDGGTAIVDVKNLRDQLVSFIFARAVAQEWLITPGWKHGADPFTRQLVSKDAGDSACSRHENDVGKRHPSPRATSSAQDAGQTFGGRPRELCKAAATWRTCWDRPAHPQKA